MSSLSPLKRTKLVTPEPVFDPEIAKREHKAGALCGTTLYDPLHHPYQAYLFFRNVGGTGSNGLGGVGELANLFGVTIGTLNNWTKRHEELAVAVQMGKDEFDSLAVETSFKRRAMGFTYTKRTTKQIHITQRIDGERVKIPAEEVILEEITVPPDTTAGIFWLKNRRPDRWKDVRQTEGRILHGHLHKVMGSDGNAIISATPETSFTDEELALLAKMSGIEEDDPTLKAIEYDEFQEQLADIPTDSLEKELSE